jgi:hypothetical protein
MLKLLALMINILGVPAIFFTGLLALEIPIVLVFASASDIAIWCLVVTGICSVILPFLIIKAVINSWDKYKKSKYADAIKEYKWVLLDLSILIFLYVATGIGLFKK